MDFNGGSMDFYAHLIVIWWWFNGDLGEKPSKMEVSEVMGIP